jgi:hypothetical protein
MGSLWGADVGLALEIDPTAASRRSAGALSRPPRVARGNRLRSAPRRSSSGRRGVRLCIRSLTLIPESEASGLGATDLLAASSESNRLLLVGEEPGHALLLDRDEEGQVAAVASR